MYNRTIIRAYIQSGYHEHARLILTLEFCVVTDPELWKMYVCRISIFFEKYIYFTCSVPSYGDIDFCVRMGIRNIFTANNNRLIFFGISRVT